MRSNINQGFLLLKINDKGQNLTTNMPLK